MNERLKSGRNRGDRLFGFLLRLAAWLTIALFAGMLIFITRLSWEAMSTIGVGFWSETDWNPPMEVFGAAPFIAGTLASSAIAVLISAPVSIGTAIFCEKSRLEKWRKSWLSWSSFWLQFRPLFMVYGVFLS